MNENFDPIDREMNDIANAEAAKQAERIAKAREIPSDKDFMKELSALNAAEAEKILTARKRLKEVRNIITATEHYMGDGLAEAMPIGEVIGFLEAKAELSQGTPYEQVVALAAKALKERLGSDITEKTLLVDVIALCTREEAKIEEEMRGEKPQVALDSDSDE